MKKIFVVAICALSAVGMLAADGVGIIEKPAGEKVLGTFEALACNESFLGIQVQKVVGPTDVVWNRAEGRVYIKNIVPGLSDAYVVGTISADGKGVEVSLPQQVAQAGVDETQTSYPVFVSIMTRVPDYDGTSFAPEADATKNIARYACAEDGTLTLTSPVTAEVDTDPSGLPIFPQSYLGAFIRAPKSVFDTLDPGEEDVTVDQWYSSVGTFTQTIAPLPADLVYNTIPDDLTWDDSWRIVSVNGDGQMCSVAISGNDFYIRHLADELPEGVIKGVLADGKVTFPNRQFMGVAEKFGGNYLFFLGADYEEEYDPYFGSMMRFSMNNEDVVMRWDADKNTLTQLGEKKGFIVNGTLESIMLYKGFANPVVALQTEEDVNAAPLPPTVEAFIPGSGGFPGFVKISYHLTNVNQAILDPQRLYYSIYVNGEKVIFTPEKYGVPEETDRIPFTYTDAQNGSIYSTATGAMIDIYQDDIYTIGAQAIYQADRHTYYYSTIDTLEVAGLSTVETGTEATAVRYYDLQGRPVETPAAGQFLIKVSTMSDGTVNTSKLIAK